MTEKRTSSHIIPYRRPFRLNVGLIMFLVIFIYVLISLLTYLTSHKTEVYEVRKLMIADTLCIFTDLSAQPGKMRTLFYLFIRENRIVKFFVNIQQENYQRRKEEFTECLKTLKFD